MIVVAVDVAVDVVVDDVVDVVVVLKTRSACSTAARSSAGVHGNDNLSAAA